MGTIQAASPSDSHDVLHSYTTGIVSCDLDVMQSKKTPKEAIKSLFFNTYSALTRILKSYYSSIKNVASDAIRMQQVSATEECVGQAHDLRTLFECLEIDKKWNDLHFLDVAITNLPLEASKEREAAQLVLGHYKSHLRAFMKATSIKEGRSVLRCLPRKQGREERLAVTEITVDKEIEDYTCRDCLDLWTWFLIEALEIPEDRILFCDAKRGNSTILIFMLPHAFAGEIEEKLSRPGVVWVIMQLGILRVHAVGIFNKDLSQVLPVMSVSICEGLESGEDYMSLTKVCSYGGGVANMHMHIAVLKSWDCGYLHVHHIYCSTVCCTGNMLIVALVLCTMQSRHGPS